ncbi:hypothetical protein B0H14DRAFT_3457889 [Mycena olivaceomarginata]|nr:hypothetical protein B0H14DRAFT_3457889 [Mycena olivaceomarginata]
MSLPSLPTWLSSVRRNSFVDAGSSSRQSLHLPAASTDILLLDTPSALETHIGTTRRALTEMSRDAHAHVQGVVSQRVHRRRD